MYRVLSEGALRQWHEFRGTAAAAALFADGTLVETTEVEEDGKTLLEHARVPLISYFYEWSFDMLKDAALLTLDITEKLLESGFIMKDATPFNIQFLGSRPVFIDIGSIVEYEETEGWVGYAQFLETFMYPLMIASLRNVSFQPFLRSHIDGLPMEFMRSLFGWMDIFKPGVFGDILLRDIVAARTKRRAGQNANIGGADLKVP
ncbi:MAG TPA: methyltransferase, partial [Nitrospinae bacterium]|nr:methyltransferase [Nitrospinota bacterium]